ncbi:hypothetical protein IAD21_01519 [Abditibacteriota bacterium]|nr:hypothetical protein IAD21_01519 [Abditibacteriota bacterium]
MRPLGVFSVLAATLGVGSSAFAQTTPTATPVPVIAGSTFVPASGFFDFVPDTGRGLVYFSRGTQILRWRRSDQSWLAPVEVGGSLRALDISPDGNTLAVADASPSTLGSPTAAWARVALVNLNTLAVSNILYALRSGENGAYSLAYDAGGNLLISPSITPGQANGGAFHIWNAASNQVSTLYARTSSGTINDFPVASNTAIVADTTRSCLSFVEIGSSTGNWGFYTPGTGGAIGTLTRFMGVTGINGGNYPGEYPYGIAPDTGSRFFIPTAGALQVRSSTGAFLARYGGSGTTASPNLSAAYDSSRSLLYLTPTTSSKIEIRDPSNFSSRATLNAGMAWPSSPSNTPPYTVAHMRAAANGTLLGVQVTDGVRLYTLENGLPAGPPVVTNSLTTPEDTPYPFTFGTDPSAVYNIVQPPAHGALTGTGPNYTYTPAANYNGSDFFAVAINGSGRGVSVTVTPVNDAPVAVPGSTSIHINESRTISLYATDVDLPQGAFSDPNFTIEIVTGPAHGTLTHTSSPYPIYNYVPQTDYAGDDSFTFRAFDGQAYSSTATFSIKNIGPVPVARDDSFTVTLDSSVSIAAPGVLSNDTQSSISTLSGALNVSSGLVTLNADGSFTWTAGTSGPPASNIVNFQYRLSDSSAQSTGTVTLRLVPLVAQSQNGTIPEDVPARIHLNAYGATTPTLAITKNPSHGTLSGTVPDVTYTPDRDWNGTDSFEFTASDGTHTATGTISITVTPINDAPTATDSTLATDEDTPLDLTLPASDVEGDALTFEIVQAPSIGTLAAGATPGSYTYTPPANFNGPVYFNWRANDGALNSRVALAKINVAPVNDAPVAQPQTVVTDEDITVPIQLTATDVDNNGGQLSFKITKEPTHGQLVGTAPNLFYRPDANTNGTDSFEFTANDGSLDSATAKVSITVNPVNDAPTAQSQTVTGDEDTNIDVTLGGSDTEGDALTFQITRQPAHGTLKREGNAVVYRAFDDWNGTDSFGFTANDGQLSSAEANVTVIVRPVSDTPVAHADAYTTDEDTALTIAAPGVLSNDVDVDGETLKAVLKLQPANGSVALSANGGFSYTPDRNWSGTDSFTYAASDGTLESAPVTVTITVTPVNDAPVARPDVQNGSEDEALSISSNALLANDFDAEGDALSITAVTNPAHGTLVAQDGGYLYTPDANWNGDDAFIYTVSDGQATATATVTLHIKAVNDAPTAAPQALSLDEDTTKNIVLVGSDVEGDALTYTITRQPANGILSGTAPNLTYTPNANFNGSDSFAFVANDGTVNSAPATIALTVNPINDAPVALAQGIALDEDTAKSFTLGGSDIEGDALTFKVTRAPAHGTLSGTAPALTFTPDANWNGTTSLDFTVSDGSLESAPATVQIRVNPVNDAPIAAAQSATTNEDTPKAIALGASDVDGDALTFKITRQPAKGTLVLNGASATYTPGANFNGSDSFLFVANDGTVDSAPATVSITVIPVNDAPVATPQSVTLDEDTSKAIVLSGTDIDGDVLAYAVTVAPTNGTLSGTAPNLTYTPKANFNGTDAFTFSVTDPSGLKSSALVSLTVRPVNDAPTATPLSITTTASTAKSFSVAANASDVDGDALTFALKTAPANGTVSSQGGANFTYTPRLAFVGTDSFTISATDPSGATATIQVTATVSAIPGVNHAPSSQGSNFLLLEDGTLTFNLTATDQDGDVLTYLITQNPQYGALTAKGGASFTFTPPANYYGAQTFNFQVRDARGATSNISTVQLQTNAVNDAPDYDLSSTVITVAKNSNVFQQSGFARNLNVGGLPYEQGQVITFSLQTSDTSLFDQQPGISSDGTLVFRPRNGKTGTATITINARDNGGTSDGGKDTAPVKTFTITIR